MFLNKDLLSMPWTTRDNRHWNAGVVLPERMVALKHPKAARLLSDMAIKYGLIQHYLPVGASVLDVGCGSGYGASIMRSFGYEATGVDINEHILSYARQRPGISIVHGKVEDMTEMFDGVTSVDMIEHVSQAEQLPLVKAMVARLKDKGVFLIDTPFREKSCSVSKHHLWELGHGELGWLVDQVGPWKTVDKFYTVRFHDTYTVCVKSNGKPPEIVEPDVAMYNQIIVAVK